MRLEYALRLATGWEFQPVRSANTLFTPLFLPWVPLLLFIWCWLSGEICGSISGPQREIPGIIYNTNLIQLHNFQEKIVC